MQVLSFQSYTLLTLQSVKDIFTTTHYAGDMIVQMDQIGVGSLLIVIVALVCVGGVVVLNSSSQFSRFGATALTGDAVSLALLRIGPVHIAFAAGRTPPEWPSELGPWSHGGVDDARTRHTRSATDDPMLAMVLVPYSGQWGLRAVWRTAVATITHLSAEQF
jgi:hypothetical protein